MPAPEPANNVAIVVPCFNEAQRLDTDAFSEFIRQNRAFHFVFVNDGSTDDTAQVLASLHRELGFRQVAVVNLDQNSGKAEATRQGLQFALDETFADPRGIGFVGYLDADLATPLEELLTFQHRAVANPHIQAVVGSRLHLAGRSIERKWRRRLVGSVFATLTTMLFQLGLRDTQCGAKLFRNQPWLQELVRTPFHDRWLFDVEIFIRMRKMLQTDLHSIVYEQPLERWIDAAGSRLKLKDFLMGPFKLAALALHYQGPAESVFSNSETPVHHESTEEESFKRAA